MTRLQKALELHPERTATDILTSRDCPYNLIPSLTSAICDFIDCKDCWNKEYKEYENES